MQYDLNTFLIFGAEISSALKNMQNAKNEKMVAEPLV
jgi:hypothetical protein